MIDLLKEYYDARNRTQEMMDNCKDEDDLKILKSIYNEMNYIIDWIRTGHNPSDKSIDSIQCYLVDHKTLEAVINENMYEKVSVDEYDDYINDDENTISLALSKLSKRELEVFIMFECEKMKARQISDLLKIKKTSVDSYVERARQKVNDYIFNAKIKNLIIDLEINRYVFDYLIKKYEIHIDEKQISILGEDTKEKAVIEFILKQLGKAEYKVYLLHEIKGESYKSISKLLNVRETTVIQNYKNAINKLDEYFNQIPNLKKEAIP